MKIINNIIRECYISYLLDKISESKLKNKISNSEYEKFQKWIKGINSSVINVLQEKVSSEISRCLDYCRQKLKLGNVSRNEYQKCTSRCTISIKNKQITKLLVDRSRCHQKSNSSKCKERIDQKIRKLKLDIEGAKRGIR